MQIQCTIVRLCECDDLQPKRLSKLWTQRDAGCGCGMEASRIWMVCRRLSVRLVTDARLNNYTAKVSYLYLPDTL